LGYIVKQGLAGCFHETSTAFISSFDLTDQFWLDGASSG